jgi:hypothetical protein
LTKSETESGGKLANPTIPSEQGDSIDWTAVSQENAPTNHPQMTQIAQMLRNLSTLSGAIPNSLYVICVICGLSSWFNVSPKHWGIIDHPQMMQITKMLRNLSPLLRRNPQTCFCVICVICGLSSAFNVTPKHWAATKHNIEVSHSQDP